MDLFCLMTRQGDKIAPFLFIVVLDNFLRISLDNVEENISLLKHCQSSR